MIFYWKLYWIKDLEWLIALADSYVFHGDLEKIVEITYTYKELDDIYLLNETLFEDYLKINYNGQDVAFLWRKYKYKIQVQLVIIEEILKKSQKIKTLSRSESLRRGMFCDALEYVKNILEISVLWVEFEVQKSGYSYNLTAAKIKKQISKIEKREQEAFGSKVIESSEEFSFCYNFIVKNHESKKKYLSEKDKKSMKKYLKIIHDSRKCELIETPDIQRKLLRWDFLKKEMSRKDYRKVFDSVCELYGLPQRTKLSNAGSIYDGDNFLEIPRNDAHANFTIERLFKLLTHEIESHYINAFNGKMLIWNFRWAKNLPKEEGLAKFMEKIFNGYSYENIDSIIDTFFTMMAWECLIGEDFEDFMRIMWREYKCKENYRVSVNRAKRNYSPDYPGVQHKDVVYFRWLRQTVEYLEKWWEFRKLFLWKVWFHDLDNLTDICESCTFQENLVFPIFISDLVYFYFTNKQKDEKFEFNSAEYYLYLKKKYWFIDIETFKIIKHIESKSKEIKKIIKLFEKIIL